VSKVEERKPLGGSWAVAEVRGHLSGDGCNVHQTAPGKVEERDCNIAHDDAPENDAVNLSRPRSSGIRMSSQNSAVVILASLVSGLIANLAPVHPGIRIALGGGSAGEQEVADW
jgi:hypothetical protein